MADEWDLSCPCPCCGYVVFPGALNWYNVCPICFWENDPAQLRFPTSPSAANGGVSLLEAQRNYDRFGACEPKAIELVRPPEPAEQRDPNWRPLDPSLDDFEFYGMRPPEVVRDTWPEPYTRMYYWNRDFWRRRAS